MADRAYSEQWGINRIYFLFELSALMWTLCILNNCAWANKDEMCQGLTGVVLYSASAIPVSKVKKKAFKFYRGEEGAGNRAH